ncbi:hypothetical protein B0H14DRAFT_3538272 [Mycena olivaceomarginata]|nr:hypothetical protein B0H14DRAFT_3538272 [Mycena olivaceomarginata]
MQLLSQQVSPHHRQASAARKRPAVPIAEWISWVCRRRWTWCTRRSSYSARSTSYIASLENATAFIAAADPGFTHLLKGPQTWTQTIEVHNDFSFKSLPVNSWVLAYELDFAAKAIAQMRSGNGPCTLCGHCS